MRTGTSSVLVLALWSAIFMGVANARRENNDVKKIAHSTNQFAMNLLQQVESQPGNVILSPLSVSTLLAMLQQGARERSATQLEKTLQLTSEDSRNGYQNLISRLNNHETKTILKFSNRIFLKQDFDLQEDFQQSMRNHFSAEVVTLNFQQPFQAAQTINSWVHQSTGGKIPGIINRNAISGRTEMIMVNTIYFKGMWLHPFKTDGTTSEPFQSGTHQPPIGVKMMKLEATLRAGEDKNDLKAKWVELPYEDFEYSLIVVLPDDNLDALIQRMGPTHLDYLANSDSVKEVKLQLPRFKIETSLSLVPILNTLGVLDVFSQDSHLEGISTTKTPLVVSNILHKAKIEVNEEGSEAAAASAILVNTLSLPPTYDSFQIKVDRPFLAVILDKSSKLPVFMAKVTEPDRS